MRRNLSRTLPAWAWAVIGIVVSSCIAAYLVLRHRPRAAAPPPVVVVSECQNVVPGMYRVARALHGGFPIRFDVRESSLVVIYPIPDTSSQDVYYVKPKSNRAITLQISNGELYGLERDLRSAWPVFSEYVEQRDVHSANGQVVGEDHWGVWSGPKRWRVVKFRTGEEVGYPPTPAKEAALFDQVISSACFAAPVRQ